MSEHLPECRAHEFEKHGLIILRGPAMTKYEIDWDEWYPVYSLGDMTFADDGVDLTDLQVAEVTAAEEKFNRAQKILKDALCASLGHTWNTTAAWRDRPERTACRVCGVPKPGGES